MIWLIFSHYIGDVALQSEWIIKNKRKFWYAMLSHCIIWTACISIALEYVNKFDIWKVLFLIIGHWLSDSYKISIYKTKKDKIFFYIDQIWHLIQCAIVYYL